VNKPWIAFKVLAAGAIRPESGFRYAFENGADFICVGMFDFQVAANAQLASRIIHDTQQRERPWVA
jgi:NAD(P)H-dependent flavin oxidoreductase YrpB (nitropropane dioxygenase family)